MDIRLDCEFDVTGELVLERRNQAVRVSAVPCFEGGGVSGSDEANGAPAKEGRFVLRREAQDAGDDRERPPPPTLEVPESPSV